MDALKAGSVWVKGFDGRGVVCWRNNFTGQVVYSDPERVGLAVGPSPNTHQFVEFFSKPGWIESAWDEYTDAQTKTKYWHNRITKETTWKDPKPKLEEKKEPKMEKREQDLWSRVNNPTNGKGWYNKKTKKFQIERPDCLRKYV